MFIPKWTLYFVGSIIVINIILDIVIYLLKKKKDKLEKEIDEQWKNIVDLLNK